MIILICFSNYYHTDCYSLYILYSFFSTMQNIYCVLQSCIQDSNQACKFFKWLDKNTCSRGRATAPLVHERFTRYKAEAAAARNERDKAHAMEAVAWEQLRIAKHKTEKTKLALLIAEDKLYKYRLALLLSWIVVGVYFVFSIVLRGHGHTQLRLP